MDVLLVMGNDILEYAEAGVIADLNTMPSNVFDLSMHDLAALMRRPPSSSRFERRSMFAEASSWALMGMGNDTRGRDGLHSWTGIVVDLLADKGRSAADLPTKGPNLQCPALDS